MKYIRLAVASGVLLLTSNTQAQSWNLVFGLSQVIFLNGGNVEINYLTEKFVFEYSHGFNLDLNASPSEMALTDMERQQSLEIFVPYSTGGGVGYRFTKAFNARVEFKQHRFDVTHPSGEKISYTTQDLGLGAYYFYQPFRRFNFVIVPSIRYWPTINTSLNDDKHTFSNGVEHEAHDFGLFGNVSIGWRF
jgi:hypothetical protein